MKVPAAAFSMARPPATEPVKLTWSILPEPSSFSVWAWLSTMFWNTPFGRPGLLEGLGEALADQQRLRGVLEDHRVAGHQRRHDGVDGGEVGIVPRRDDHDDAERLLLHVAAEAVLRVRRQHRGERLLGDLDHVLRAFLDAAELAAIAHRPAHLPGESPARSRRSCATSASSMASMYCRARRSATPPIRPAPPSRARRPH